MLCYAPHIRHAASDRTKILIPSSLILVLTVQSRRQDMMWVPQACTEILTCRLTGRVTSLL